MNHPGYKSVLVKEDLFSILKELQSKKSYRHIDLEMKSSTEVELPFRLDLKDIVTAFLEVGIEQENFGDEVLKRAARNLTQYMNERMNQ